jgi:6-phosphogluconate dehydrogenase
VATSEEAPVKIGFIGLGKMGGNMVKRLLRGGHEVAIWNRSREKTDEIAEGEAIMQQFLTHNPGSGYK